MARYLSDKKALFQHIPHTGGTWINQALRVLGIKHGLWSWDRQPSWLPSKHAPSMHYFRKPMVEVRFVFAFVRHPLAYYESAWRYVNTGERGRRWVLNHASWHPDAAFAANWRPRFADAVKAVLDEEPGIVTRLYELYCGPAGGEICGFIGRQETLEEDFRRLMRLLGYGHRWRRRRRELAALGTIRNRKARTQNMAHLIDWTDGLRERVLRAERPAVRRFYEGDNAGQRLYAELAEPLHRMDWRIWRPGRQPDYVRRVNPLGGKQDGS